MINGILVKNLYSESTIDEALGCLRQLQIDAEDLEDILHNIGIDKMTLTRTVKKGVEEYVDGLVDLRHGWKPKMMDGSPEEKGEIYDGLHDTIRRMDAFSEPYVSAMRLLSNVALRQLGGVAKQTIEEALSYEGARYDFDEQTISVVQRDGVATKTKKMKPASLDEACAQVAGGFMHLKNLLNLMEDATTPEVYESVRNTNEFPEARIGKCFEVTSEIDRTMKQVAEGYEFLSKEAKLPRTDKKRIGETLKLLKGLDRGNITRATQFYAALQFHEKPWDRAYKASIAATMAGVAGAAYSFRPFLEDVPNYSLMFLASAAWTIISGLSIYAFTDMGPKTAKLFRKLDERFIRYERI